LGGVVKADKTLSVGVNTFFVRGIYEGAIDEIVIHIAGTPGHKVVFDWICVCDNTYVRPDIWKLEGEFSIVQKLINEGASTAKFTVQNTGGIYSGLINGNDIVIIRLSKKGESLKKEFGGRLEQPIYEGIGGPNEIITFNCLGHGFELFSSPNHVIKNYEAVNGKTIIQDALDKTEILAAHPTKFFNCHTPPSDIASVHTVVYDEEIPGTVIQEILEKAKNVGGSQGFDAYITPAGCMVGHPRDSDYHTYAPLINLKNWSHNKDVHRIANAQTVYGAAEKLFPLDGDSRTEQNASESPADDSWESSTGATLSWETDVGKVMVGGEALKASQEIDTMFFKNTWASALCCESWRAKAFGQLKFGLMVVDDPDDGAMTIDVYVLAPNSSNSFVYRLPKMAEGSSEMYVINVKEGSWILKYGNPDYSNIKGVEFKCDTALGGPGVPITVLVDGFHFSGARFEGYKEDADSMKTKKKRMPKPIVDDSLKSDTECLLRAQSVVNTYKDEFFCLQDAEINYGQNFALGDKINVHLLSPDYRLIRHVISLEAGDLSSFISLSNEPTLIDLAFKKVFEDSKRLNRRMKVL